MQQGSFYCFVPRKSSVPGWLPFVKAAQKVLRKRFDALLNSSRAEVLKSSGGEPGVEEETVALSGRGGQRSTHPDFGGTTSWIQDPHSGTHTFYLPGGAATVRYGWYELAGSLYRMQPHVYRDERAIIVFYGHLSNVNDLLLHFGMPSKEVFRAVDGARTDGKSMVQLNMDIGTLTSRVLMSMFLDHRDKDPLWVLSELQGQYAFVIYDGTTKQAFAARDPSGKQPLYYHPDPEQGVSFANHPIDIPTAHGEGEWVEVPPGYFIAGKNHRLQQFALTREELQVVKSREFSESPIDEDWWLSSGSPAGHGGLFSSLSRPFNRRRSCQLDDQWIPDSI